MNFSAFKVDVDKSNEYFVEFWLLPARYPDGRYTKFFVYVNDAFVGQITPTKDNWQATRIDGNKKIRLNEGSNEIKIGVRAPEMPDVEKIEIASSNSEVEISSASYEEFYKKATAGESYELPKEISIDSYSNFGLQSTHATYAQEVTPKIYSDVPLLYTFYKNFSFNQDELLVITTQSTSEHDVDVMFLGDKIGAANGTIINGSSYETDFKASNGSIFQNTESFGVGTIPSPNPAIYKLQVVSRAATSEEQQGLNWKGLSRQSPYSSTNTITKVIRIPQTGVYMIRLRHRMAGYTGTVSLRVNEKYIFTDVPISFIWLPFEMHANGVEYGSMTYCSDPTNDDPMLFIHGADADRIVGFNDDASRYRRLLHELTYTDSHVMQEYIVKTSGISVCNYQSSNPESVCEIIAGLDESLFSNPELLLMPEKSEENARIGLLSSLNDVEISGSLEKCNVLKVKSQSSIQNISIYDTYGNLINTFKGDGASMSIPGASINIPYSGIYIVRVENDNGIVSKKLIVE